LLKYVTQFRKALYMRMLLPLQMLHCEHCDIAKICNWIFHSVLNINIM
jgi:hypothetical protein